MQPGGPSKANWHVLSLQKPEGVGRVVGDCVGGDGVGGVGGGVGPVGEYVAPNVP